MCKITTVNAREILDSRGNPTIEAEVFLSCGKSGVASVPSGASTGTNEALELRDHDKNRYGGLGVQKAVKNINLKISPLLGGINVFEQRLIDQLMIDEDGTKDKSNLGANAILAVSLASARAAANLYNMELYRYLGGINACRLPIPMINIVNGGRHSDAPIAFQEFMIVPKGAENFAQAVEMGAEVFHSLKKVLKKYKMNTSVGDEGGFAPNFKSIEDTLDCIIEAIDEADYQVGRDIFLALDCAATEFYRNGEYDYSLFDNSKSKKLNSAEQVNYLKKLVSNYPICSIEDGLSEDDWPAWTSLTQAVGEHVNIVGDDLFVTNSEFLRRGISEKSANSILVKLNQIGSLSETLDVIELAQRSGFKTIISHRSGETEDSFISDLSVAVNSRYIKCGSMSRSERIVKYNRLLRIERDLFKNSQFN